MYQEQTERLLPRTLSTRTLPSRAKRSKVSRSNVHRSNDNYRVEAAVPRKADRTLIRKWCRMLRSDTPDIRLNEMQAKIPAIVGGSSRHESGTILIRKPIIVAMLLAVLACSRYNEVRNHARRPNCVGIVAGPTKFWPKIGSSVRHWLGKWGVLRPEYVGAACSPY
jgi:hypothetical protein